MKLNYELIETKQKLKRFQLKPNENSINSTNIKEDERKDLNDKLDEYKMTIAKLEIEKKNMKEKMENMENENWRYYCR